MLKFPIVLLFTLTSTLVFGQSPINDDRIDAIEIFLGDTIQVNNEGATPDGPHGVCHVDNEVQRDVWYKFTLPDTTGTLKLRTFSDGSGTFTDPQFNLINADLEILDCDDDGAESFYSLIEFDICDIDPEQILYLQIDAYGSDHGTCSLSFTRHALAGCTDVCSSLYEPCASADDGGDCSWFQPPYSWCLDPDAWNYDPNAPETCHECLYNQPDINGNGYVDSQDLIYFMFFWGIECVEDCLGDFNGDGIVNPADLLIFLN